MPTRVFGFLYEIRSELTKVTWPSRAQTIRMTVIVLVVSALMAAFIASLDYVFTRLFGILIQG